jgi:DNA-binding response OmpR family regulator
METGGESKGLVLIVEDEQHIADLQRLYLAKAGFGVHHERDGAAGLAAAQRLRPVAILLDVALPSLDGLEICRRLRQSGDSTPVLLVTARDDEVDRILGLELGADDYITKPFSPRELVARVRAVLRRGPGEGTAPILRVGAVSIDPGRRLVTVMADGEGERAVATTATEFDLLAYLARQPGRVFSREQLLSGVWGYASAAGTRTVDVHVAQLRAKLGPAAEVIRTVRGVGYAAANSAAAP